MPKLERWIGTLAVVLAVPAAAAAAQDHGHDGRHGQADHATMNSGAVITVEGLTEALALTADQQQAITPHLAAVNRTMKALHDALGDDHRATDIEWATASPELPGQARRAQDRAARHGGNFHGRPIGEVAQATSP